MANLDQDEANILDAETVNWRMIVYPVLAGLVLVVGGLGVYYYQLDQREKHEAVAHAAFVAAKTPADWLKVADQYPGTDQALLALMSAADGSFNAHDYPAALVSYQRVLKTSEVPAELRDSAQIGVGSSQEAAGKIDDAITAYLEVAHRGSKSAFAPFAYTAAARLYEERGDKDNMRKTLTELVSLDPDSIFVKQAQQKLKELNTPPMTFPITGAPAVK